MKQAEIDLMDVRHPTQLRRAYHDLDGRDWRLAPHDDAAVLDALQPDPLPGAARRATPRTIPSAPSPPDRRSRPGPVRSQPAPAEQGSAP